MQVKQNLRIKANNRTESENRLWDLFENQTDRVKFLDITPELGIWLWIKSNHGQFQNLLNDLYPDISINSHDLLRDCNAAIPNVSPNPRDDAKSRISWLINEISAKTNEDKKRIKHSLIVVYLEGIYSDPQNVNNLKSIFGPIFNKQGN